MTAQAGPGRLRVIGAMALLSLIWGTTWAVIQIGLRGVPPFSGVSVRFAIASAVLLVAAIATGVRLGRSRRERALWIVNGVCSFTISYGVVYWCEQWVPSGLAAVLFATYPIFVALMAQVALPAESISKPEIAGIAAAFVGVAVIFSEDLAALGGPEVVTASAVMLISPIAAAAGSVCVKRWGAGVHPLSLTVVPMAIGSGITGAIALATERSRVFAWDATAVGAILYLAIPGSAVTFLLFYWLLSHLPAKRVALVSYIVPVVAVAVGVARGEPLAPRALAGAALVIGGVALAVHRRAPGSA